jgi:hypothetical protein
MHYKSISSLIAKAWLAQAVRGGATRPKPCHGSGDAGLAAPTAVAIPAPPWSFAVLPTPLPMSNEADLELRKRDEGWGEKCGYVSGDARMSLFSPGTHLLPVSHLISQ